MDGGVRFFAMGICWRTPLLYLMFDYEPFEAEREPKRDKPVIDKFRGAHFFLSNFFTCRIEYQGQVYPSSEHAFQAAKTLDPLTRAKFTNPLMKCSKAKQLGGNLELREHWDDIRVSVMRDILRIKFARRDLKTLLVGTHPAELIEGNTWFDTFWGKHDGVGENQLGKLLMELREELRNV